jgi:hypothetical protein
MSWLSRPEIGSSIAAKKEVGTRWRFARVLTTFTTQGVREGWLKKTSLQKKKAQPKKKWFLLDGGVLSWSKNPTVRVRCALAPSSLHTLADLLCFFPSGC